MVDIYQIRPGSYATVAEVKEEGGGSGDVTKAYVDDQIASVRSEIPDVSGLATKTEVETGLGAKKDKSTLYTTGGADAETESNPIALKDFVNSSIGTNTANYISNNGEPFTSVDALESYSGTVTNNDYAFVTGTDTDGNTYYDRYKATVNGETVTWAKEYRLNNSSFTQAQWNAINSGITSGKVATYDGYATTIAGKQDAGDYATTTALNTAIAGIRQVPASTSEDEDKVLTVDANGDIGWETGGGGSAPSNMVTTDTEQTITSLKTVDILPTGGDPATVLSFKCYRYGTPADVNLCCGTLGTDRIFQINFGCATPRYRFHEDGSNKLAYTRIYDEYTVLNTGIFTKGFIPESTITGDGTTTTFTVSHSMNKMPGIVQVTKATGEVMKDTEVSIVKSTTNVVVTFTTAPASDDVYTVAMLY